MKKVMVGVTVALALVTSNAAADGIDRRPAPSIAAPAPVYAPTWTGFYIGAGVGGSAVVHDFSIDDVDLRRNHFDGFGADGVFGTVIVGWDWQVGVSTVLGLFVDYDFHNNSADISLLGGDVRAGIDHDNAWSVGARLGFLSSPSALWYATAGYTEAQFEGFVSVEGLGTISRDRTFNGYFVGGGVDTRLAASNWYLRLEYRFSDFSSERLFEDEFTRLDVDPTVHSARLTLTYKLGGASGYGYGWSGWNGWGR